MSATEYNRRRDRQQPSTYENPLHGLSQREPPSNIQAEHALLGACLANNAAFQAVVGFLRPEHFSDPINGKVYREIGRGVLKGNVVDAVTLKAILQNAGILDEVGGTSYLTQLLSAMVGIAVASEYGRAIHDCAVRRSVIDICAESIERAFGSDTELDGEGVIQALTDQVMDLSARGSKDVPEVAIGDAARLAIRAAEAEARGEVSNVVYSGLKPLDDAIGGFRGGWFYILGGRPGQGKQQPIDTPTLTPSGWVPIGLLNVGDAVIGSDGRPTKVVAIHPRGVEQAFRVRFRDGSSVECGADHLWSVIPSGGRGRGKIFVRSLADLVNGGICRPKSCGRRGAKWHVPLVKPVEFPVQDLPIDPYVLGVLIGDGALSGGDLRFSNSDRDADIRGRVYARLPDGVTIAENRSGACPYISLRGPVAKLMRKSIQAMGLNVKSPEKAIPAIYLRSSRSQRLDLLRGLMDTDGCAAKRNRIIFCTTSKRLAIDVIDLVRSLGGVSWMRTHNREHQSKPTEYDVVVKMAECPFTTQWKASRWRPQLPSRYIVAVEPSRWVEQRCITVEAHDGLYVTNDYIVTHNSSLCVQAAVGTARALRKEAEDAPAFSGAGGVVLFFSAEMPVEQVGGWAACHIAGIGNDVLNGERTMTAGEAAAFLSAQRELDGLPIRLIDAVGMSGPAIALRARAVNQKHRVRLVVIDHIQKLVNTVDDSRRNQPDRTGDTAKITSALKDLARKMNCPVVALAQLKRDVEMRDNPRPRLSDMMHSGEADADVAMFLYREETYLPRTPPEAFPREKEEQHQKRKDAWHKKWDAARNRADLIVAKRRQGPLSETRLAFNGATSTFSQLAGLLDEPSVGLWDDE